MSERPPNENVEDRLDAGPSDDDAGPREQGLRAESRGKRNIEIKRAACGEKLAPGVAGQAKAKTVARDIDQRVMAFAKRRVE